MGSSNSPALACRYGLGMLRLLAKREPVFQGCIQENGWRARLAGDLHDPRLGSGLVRVGSDGLPAALVWAFVDDFKIHAPTKRKLIRALNAFMNLSLRLGLICQKVKTKPPAQIQKYCGFLFDTTGIPTLRLPEAKWSRGLATIGFLKAGGPSLELSRLSLAVVTGLLQSMVEATPQRIGQTFLRRLYDRLHMLDQQTDERLTGKALYFTRVQLTAEEWLDLDWWASALALNPCVTAYSANQGALGLSYGDGSGSGTGGTVQVVGREGACPPLETWMGTWCSHVHSFSSNWRELRTLVFTLEREVGGCGRLIYSTLFYFTDNLVMYYIVSGSSSKSPELQRLLRRLKYLELLLGIRLEVVHIPGTHMIDQGTDGLSRGLHLGGGRLKRTTHAETQRIFEGVPVTPSTLQWARAQVLPECLHHECIYMDANQTWSFLQVSRRATLWFPAPEWAHQLLEAVIFAWIERPWDTEAFFVVPRVFQRDWGRVSRHIVELGVFPAASVPVYGLSTDIPCVILHLPCYVRSLPPPRRLDEPPRPPRSEWHRDQAEQLRGLS
jgi:hypothetical protein